MADRRDAEEPAGELRVPDAARRARGACDAARARRPPPARVRAVRRAVVSVLVAPSPGEPGNGRRDRALDGRPRAPPRPMIWARAEGCRVTLADGRELLDLTGGFGVAALGHRNARILEVWRE